MYCILNETNLVQKCADIMTTHPVFILDAGIQDTGYNKIQDKIGHYRPFILDFAVKKKRF